MNKPRKWYVAGILSVLCPGLGQIYNGNMRLGLVLLICPYPFALIALWACFILPKAGLLALSIFLIIGVSAFFFALTDAIVTALKQRHSYELKRFNRLGVYVGIYLFVIIFSRTSAVVGKVYLIEPFTMAGDGMSPTLMSRDRFLVDKRNSARQPQRGDIVVYRSNLSSDKPFVLQRIVAVGGDQVEIKGGKLFVNGEKVTEEYTSDYRKPDAGEPQYIGPLTLEPGSYYMLGDNAGNSYDSRFIGPVEGDKILGTAMFIYWPYDGEELRLNRIGRPLR